MWADCPPAPVRLRLFASFLAALAPAVGGPAVAQDMPTEPGAAVLTLDEALALALGRNLDLAQAQNSVALAEVDVAQDRAAFGPSLSLSAGPTLSYARYASVDSTGASVGSGGDFSTGLSVGASSDLTVFDGGLRRANLAQSQSQLAATTASLSRTEEQTLTLTATQYLAVLQSAALVEVYEEALAAQEAQLDLIEANYEAGNRSLADVLQQRATIAQSRQALVTARQNVALALLDLKQTLRLPAATDVTVAPVDTSAAGATPVLDADALAALAVENRRDVEAQRLQTEAAESAIRAARAGRSPSVSVGLSAGSSYASGSGGFATQLITTRPSAGLSLGVSLPIFDRRQTQSAVERAQISLDNERLALEAAEQQAAFEAEQAALNLTATSARLDAAEAQLAAATEALDAARERYRVGAGPFAELADAQALLVDAQGEVAQARYQSLIDRVALGYAVGDVLPALDALR